MSTHTAGSFSATVTDIRLQSQSGTTAVWLLALDHTAFTPGDTGTLSAVTRTGTHLEIPVNAVQRDGDGIIWHTVEKPLAAGTEVCGYITK